MRVAVVGAGLAGLCLAQGLRGLGVEVVVVERDAAIGAHRQGYRLNLDATGAAGLAACLPEHLLHRHRALAHRQADPAVTIRTCDGTLVHSRRADSTDAVAVDRTALRHVLLTGLEEGLRLGAPVVGVEQDDDRARLLVGDGTTYEADLVIGADGPSSVVRDALSPGSAPRAVGIDGIYGRTPLGIPATATDLAQEALRSRFTGLVDDAGTMLALGAWTPGADPGATIGLDLAPYLMWAVLTPHPLPSGADPAALHRHALDLVATWTPDVARLVAAAAVPDTFRLTVRCADAVPVWTPGRVTLIGDAAHTMTPAGGQGANTALADAARLTAAVGRTLRGEADLPTAIADHDRELRTAGNAALARSASYAVPVANAPHREDRPA